MSNSLFPGWPDALGSMSVEAPVSPLMPSNLTMMNPNAAMPEGNDWLSMKGILGDDNSPGWGKLGLGAASALVNAFMGMKQYGLAKKSLSENKRQFNLNFDAQRQSVNSQLEDRQRARVASNPGAYQSVGEYMSTYGVKG